MYRLDIKEHLGRGLNAPGLQKNTADYVRNKKNLEYIKNVLKHPSLIEMDVRCIWIQGFWSRRLSKEQHNTTRFFSPQVEFYATVRNPEVQQQPAYESVMMSFRS